MEQAAREAATVFVGEYSHTLDEKFRLSLPKRFQAVLGRSDAKREVVLTRGFENCLFLFSTSGFERVLERLHTQAFGGEELRRMQRLFFSNAHPIQLDKSSRILLPEKLRSLAGIQRDVVLIGVADRAEIWDRGRWESFEKDNSKDFDKLDDVLCGAPNGQPREEGASS